MCTHGKLKCIEKFVSVSSSDLERTSIAVTVHKLSKVKRQLLSRKMTQVQVCLESTCVFISSYQYD